MFSWRVWCNHATILTHHAVRTPSKAATWLLRSCRWSSPTADVSFHLSIRYIDSGRRGHRPLRCLPSSSATAPCWEACCRCWDMVLFPALALLVKAVRVSCFPWSRLNLCDWNHIRLYASAISHTDILVWKRYTSTILTWKRNRLPVWGFIGCRVRPVVEASWWPTPGLPLCAYCVSALRSKTCGLHVCS